MLEWVKITLILCAFGTLREIRPSEPFVTEFLSGEWRNVTSDQLFRDVYPVGTYSYMAVLIVIFLITDFLRFKPVIILSGLCGISIYAILLWTTSIEWLYVTQVLYGLYMATEVAYYTYMYAKVEESKYGRVTSLARVAALAGRFVSGVTAQLLTHLHLMDYRDLNYITLSAQILATAWAFWLPSVDFGIYFHRRASVRSGIQENLHPAKDPTLSTMTSPTKVDYNGAVEAATTLAGAAGALAAGGAERAALPAAAAAAQAAAAFLTALLPHIYLSYACYILLGTLFHFTVTMASAKIASQLSDESCFGLVFGMNMFLGAVLQSLLTLALNQALTPPVMYAVLGALYLLLAAAWLAGWAAHACRQTKAAAAAAADH
ncbi:thiamine transporter 1-like isoform X3 [Leguminivora glycinivorella]|uniref:thiamine transporter 1-like isoform X3 n=1 Tax=Leguminivora glycinivorella TaxID=1035111 RepID=UPI00201093EB|nr:thiamine transporter 1-like isoform X3 [Leguminivora glycinivorella]